MKVKNSLPRGIPDYIQLTLSIPAAARISDDCIRFECEIESEQKSIRFEQIGTE